MNILLIDNFDSFTFNLVDEFEKEGCNVIVYRNNTPMETIDKEVEKTDLIVISPGPSTPKKAGNILEIIKRYHKTKPIFGVCLGHQALAEAFGGKVVKAKELIHGKSSRIKHDGKTIFTGIKSPLTGGRYHSLVAEELPACLEISARTNSTVMAIRHKKYPLEGVQFHPESILTASGSDIIRNLIRGCKK